MVTIMLGTKMEAYICRLSKCSSVYRNQWNTSNKFRICEESRKFNFQQVHYCFKKQHCL